MFSSKISIYCFLLITITKYSFAVGNYYQASFGKPANAVTLKAIELFGKDEKSKVQALDLGCGEGRDTIALLKRGWQVVAVDKKSQAFHWLNRHEAVQDHADSLICVEMSFEDLIISNLPVDSFDLIIANWSLPFCSKKHFSSVWQKLISHTKIGGRFAGNFFGKNHSWNLERPWLVFLDKTEVLNLFDSFAIEEFEEIEYDELSACGEEVHWHTYSVIAKRIK